MNERNISKRVVSVSPEISLCKKVETAFSREGDKTKSVAYIRALEEATRTIKLTPQQYAEIAEEEARNLAARQRARATRRK